MNVRGLRNIHWRDIEHWRTLLWRFVDRRWVDWVSAFAGLGVLMSYGFWWNHWGSSRSRCNLRILCLREWFNGFANSPEEIHSHLEGLTFRAARLMRRNRQTKIPTTLIQECGPPGVANAFEWSQDQAKSKSLWLGKQGYPARRHARITNAF